MAPKLIKFPETPKRFIIAIAKSIESGITEATINPPLKLPRKRISTKITIKAPSVRLVVTVPIARSTKPFLSR